LGKMEYKGKIGESRKKTVVKNKKNRNKKKVLFTRGNLNGQRA